MKKAKKKLPPWLGKETKGEEMMEGKKMPKGMPMTKKAKKGKK